MEEIEALEERELDDTIEEEEELEDEGEYDLEAGGGVFGGGRRLSEGCAHDLRSDKHKPPGRGFLKRITSMNLGLGRRQSRDEDDLMAASLIPPGQRRTPSQDRSSWLSPSGPPKSPHKQRASISYPIIPGHGRKFSDDLTGRDRLMPRSLDLRRASMSSASSADGLIHHWRGNLGLVPMDTTNLPLSASIFSSTSNQGGNDAQNEIDEGKEISYIWTANSDYGKVLRIGFKKRISALWLEAHGLRQYVELNMTAFEKILKKYDKNTNSKVRGGFLFLLFFVEAGTYETDVLVIRIFSQLKKKYISEQVLTSSPWTESSKVDLDAFIDKVHFVYARIAAGGDIELAKQQLRAQLREKVRFDSGSRSLSRY
jgi:phosphate transporter